VLEGGRVGIELAFELAFALATVLAADPDVLRCGASTFQ
jgi:hypothetical protein